MEASGENRRAASLTWTSRRTEIFDPSRCARRVTRRSSPSTGGRSRRWLPVLRDGGCCSSPRRPETRKTGAKGPAPLRPRVRFAATTSRLRTMATGSSRCSWTAAPSTCRCRSFAEASGGVKVPQQAGTGVARIVAPMPGRIVKVLVKPGDEVEARQPLIVVEAMKMENELRSPRRGRVTEVTVVEGALVEAKTVLIVIT